MYPFCCTLYRDLCLFNSMDYNYVQIYGHISKLSERCCKIRFISSHSFGVEGRGLLSIVVEMWWPVVSYLMTFCYIHVRDCDVLLHLGPFGSPYNRFSSYSLRSGESIQEHLEIAGNMHLTFIG